MCVWLQEIQQFEEFLGDPDWRAKWEASGGEFGAFIVDQFGLAMKRLGFIYNGPGEEVPVYLPTKNRKLYHLGFLHQERARDEVLAHCSQGE